jgi:hypothetical protein
MDRKLFFLIAVLWTLLTMALLIVGLTQGEARMGAQLLMTFLGFPASLLLPEVFIRLFPELGKSIFDVHGSLWQYLAEWIALFFIGALQWFVLPYWVWHKWRVRCRVR